MSKAYFEAFQSHMRSMGSTVKELTDLMKESGKMRRESEAAQRRVDNLKLLEVVMRLLSNSQQVGEVSNSELMKILRNEQSSLFTLLHR